MGLLQQIETIRNNVPLVYEAGQGEGGGSTMAKISSVNLLASAWEGGASPYSQVVTIEGTTENSKVERLATIFSENRAFKPVPVEVFRKQNSTILNGLGASERKFVSASACVCAKGDAPFERGQYSFGFFAARGGVVEVNHK